VRRCSFQIGRDVGDAQLEGSLADSGGGLCTTYRGVRVEHATFHGNEATVGAGASLGPGSAVLDRLDFINNRAGWNGGALHTGDTELNVSNSRFWRNTAGEHGGAVYMGGYAQLVNVTMMANTAPAGAGGGI
jgi:predicted outer membrane repeat protein